MSELGLEVLYSKGRISQTLVGATLQKNKK
jgi:hypothetical protein